VTLTEGAALAGLVVNVLGMGAGLWKLGRWTGVVDTTLAAVNRRLDALLCSSCAHGPKGVAP